MRALLCLVFFLSGASALCFEALWFRLSGLALGNSVLAASTVLAAFMAGLGLGNAFAIAWGHRIKFPIRFYALLEIAIAVSGLALVFLFPRLTAILAPVFRALDGGPIITGIIRLGVAFLLMLVPTGAMGATLPVLVKAAYRRNTNFGQILGMLYGWNALGAVTGVLAAELLFVRQLGMIGTGAVAFGLNLSAAILALCLSRREEASAAEAARSRFSTRAACFLAVSFLSGFVLLALEVIWFRFLLLFFKGHTQNFAVMLASVLAGISLGGMIASKVFKQWPTVHRLLGLVLFVNGVLVVLLYRYLLPVVDASADLGAFAGISLVSLFLMFPVSLLSGIIFTMLGKAVHAEIGIEARATGMLTLANTAGAALGALLAGLVLIPIFGIERSFFALALLYGVAALALFAIGHVPAARIPRYACYGATAALVAAVAFFPFGSMNDYLDVPCRPFLNEQRVAVREGLTDTVQYLRKNLLGRPHYYRHVSNSFTMSDTLLFSKRYMKLFVYLPVAIRPEPRDALLICYGSGSTARALTDTRSLRNIEIVDTSRDVVELARIVYPDPESNPLADPRVTVHIEDGRFFLLTTDRQFDLITAEPPPPGSRGVVNLYSQEYFELIYDRLADGGVVSYWLPCHFLEVSEAKAITRAFCNVFGNGSLWMGAGFNYMLVGIKGSTGQVSTEEFSRQWADPVVGPEMRSLGFASPEQFGALFIADSARLEAWLADTRPLVDNFPARVSHEATNWKSREKLAHYKEFADPNKSRANFLKSRDVAGMWPRELREGAKSHFSVRNTINDMNLAPSMKWTTPIEELDACINDPLLEDYIHWACMSDPSAQRIVTVAMADLPDETITDPEVIYHLAARAAQERKYELAEQHLRRFSERFGSTFTEYGHYHCHVFRMYFLYLLGQKDLARQVGQEYVFLDREGAATRRQQMTAYWNWLEDRLDASDRTGTE
jgi:predicted membrane-bound spermidine synthase